MDSEAIFLLPAELQSRKAEQLTAGGGKSHEPCSSLERLCSGFLGFRDALPDFMAKPFYSFFVPEKS